MVPQPESHMVGKKSSMVEVLREADGLRWVGHYPFKYILMLTVCHGVVALSKFVGAVSNKLEILRSKGRLCHVSGA